MSKYYILFIALISIATTVHGEDTSSNSDFDEVYLEFRYLQSVNSTVIGLYKDDTFYLPVTDIFNQLLIYNTVDWASLRLSGYLNLTSNSYLLDFKTGRYRFNEKSGVFAQDDFIVGEFDIFVSPRLFEEIFGIEFRIDMANLALRLFSEQVLPIRRRQERLLARARLESQLGTREIYKPTIPRSHKVFNGAFFDYNLNFNTQNFDRNTGSLGLVMGGEVLFGDVQSTLNANRNIDGSISNRWSNTRWRYHLDKPWFRQAMVGDMSPNGITVNQAIIGARITNQPLYPSRVFEEYNYTDFGIPGSEVEVYINERLYDFLEIDETGQFTLVLPISYGVNDIKIIKYSPDGQVNELVQRMAVPFYFVPPGDFFYTLTAGATKINNLNSVQRNAIIGDIAYGLNRNNTVRSKFEYYKDNTTDQASLLSEFSNRMFDRLITNLQYSPYRFYSGNLTYQSTGSNFINVSGVKYSEVYQTRNNSIEYRYSINAFVASPFKKIPVFLRAGYDIASFSNLMTESTTGALTTRYKRMSMNLAFRKFVRTSEFLSDNTLRYSVSASYSTTRSQKIWMPFRGLLMRGQIDFDDQFKRFEGYDFSLSRNIFDGGQFQVTYTKSFFTNLSSLFISVNFDIPYARFNSSARRSRQNFSLNQSVRGSVGYYSNQRALLFDNRSQVGRAAVVVNSYLDSDGDGEFSDGDQVLPFNAIRLMGGSRMFYRNGEYFFTQLRQYDTYNIEINKALIQDPTLVPLRDKFSITTDPNQYKVVNIPFSRSGIIEGFVHRNDGNSRRPLGGLTVKIIRHDDNETSTVRSFFDGSFYKMELIPGQYTVYPDSPQLAILGAYAVPDKIDFVIESNEFGDIVDVEFEIYPIGFESTRQIITPPSTQTVLLQPVVESSAQFFRIQTALMSTLPRAIVAKLEAEAATGAIFELQYSDRYKLFRLFSREVEGRENADALLEVIRRKTQYSDAFIIDEDSYDAQDIFYAVQIGAFRTLRSATIHAREARDKFNLNAVVHFDSLSRWYVIHTLEWSDWRTASQIRTDIRERTDYKDAFLVTRPPVDLKSYTFAVQIGVYTNASFADRVTDDLRRRTGMPFSTQWNPRIELYSVRLNGITTWEEALQIREQLRTEFGVTESLILSISQ